MTDHNDALDRAIHKYNKAQPTKKDLAMLKRLREMGDDTQQQQIDAILRPHNPRRLRFLAGQGVDGTMRAIKREQDGWN